MTGHVIFPSIKTVLQMPPVKPSLVKGKALGSNGSSFIDLNPQDFERQLMASNSMKKRSRTLMTPFQNKILRRVLAKTCFPSAGTRSYLANLLGISTRTIQIWFQNQRQKAKQKINVAHSSSVRIRQTFSSCMYDSSLSILAEAAVVPSSYAHSAECRLNRHSIESLAPKDAYSIANNHMRLWI